MAIERDLDEIDWALLEELQENARVAWSELGRRVGLSPPAVAERVRRLEERGVVKGYRAEVDLEKVGLPVTAFVRARLGSHLHYDRLAGVAQSMPEVLECHRVTGDDCFLMKVAVRDVHHLERLLEQIARLGPPTTSLVLSSPVTRRSVAPPEEVGEGPGVPPGLTAVSAR